MSLRKVCGYFFLLLGFGTLQAHAATGTFERTLQVSGPVRMELTSGSGNITVRTGANHSVHVVARIQARDSWFGMSAAEKIRSLEANPPIEQQGNVIRIGKIANSESGAWWFWWTPYNVSIDYDLTVPAQTELVSGTGSGDQSINGLRVSCTAKTGSGNIRVEDMVGDLQLNTGSGDLKISSVKGAVNAKTGSGTIHAIGVAGEVSAFTGSGRVEIEQVALDNATIKTGSGGVVLRGAQGGVRIETGSGEIRIEGEPTGDWHIGTGSGDINLMLPSQVSFNLDARTSSGRVDLHRPLTVQGFVSRNHFQGKAGSGGPLLDVHTGSGNIAIN